MSGELKNVYFVKNTAGGTFTDVTTLFDGLRILKVDGFLSSGKAVNVYREQWMDGTVDFTITSMSGEQNPAIVRELTELEITFIIKQKYATNTINVQTVHDSFIAYMTNTDVWIKSAYVENKQVHCVCEEEYKPTTVKLKRGVDSYIMGTIRLRMLEKPNIPTP